MGIFHLGSKKQIPNPTFRLRRTLKVQLGMLPPPSNRGKWFVFFWLSWNIVSWSWWWLVGGASQVVTINSFFLPSPQNDSATWTICQSQTVKQAKILSKKLLLTFQPQCLWFFPKTWLKFQKRLVNIKCSSRYKSQWPSVGISMNQTYATN